MGSIGARRFGRSLAVVVSAALAFGAVVALPAAAPDPAFAAEGDCLANPMGAATPVGSENGYTLFVPGDAVIANSELEGTLAVGGTATFGDPAGNQNSQYPIFHGGVGGNANYVEPTIDGAGNRVLVNRFASSSKVVQVQQRPANGSAAGAKIFDRTAPAGYTFGPQFGGSGTTYFPVGGTNQSPQLESDVQPWSGGAGAGTFVPALDTFTDYFPADRGQSILSSVTNWKTPAVTPGGETLIGLDTTGPNRLDLSDIAGASKFQVTGYSPASPLIIQVSPADVIDGRLSLPSYAGAGKETPGIGEGISYILWDLGALSGDITVTSPNEPVRGSIYAPAAHIIFPSEADGGREFEGQLIAADFTALQGGKEMHTNLFLGLLDCATPGTVGGFSLSKALSLPAGADGSAFEGATFTVTASWTIAGTPQSQSYTLTAGAAPVNGPQDLPTGTTVSFTEAAPAAVPGFTFTGVSFSPGNLVIGAGDDQIVTATNAYTASDPSVGGFSLRKQLAGDGAALVPPSMLFQVDYYLDGASQPAGRLEVPASGEVVLGPQNLAAGTVVTFTEVARPAIGGADWNGSAVFAPGSVVIAGNAIAAVVLTNTIVTTPAVPAPVVPTPVTPTPVLPTPTASPTAAATAAGTAGTTGDGLARTGSAEPWWMLGMAAALLLAGAMVLAAVRVRRSRGHRV